MAAAVYAVSALLNAAAAAPAASHVRDSRATQAGRRRGAVPALAAPAVGAVGMRAASGFLLFLLAFSLRVDERPVVLVRGARGGGVLGRFLADVVAPRVPRTTTREEAVVIACVSAACIGALLAFELFGLPLLTVYAFVAGAATEFGRLAFQSLMQRHAPPGAQGRVFVRYEVMFQLAWAAGAFLPALLPIDFRVGILILAAFYGVLGVGTVLRARLRAADVDDASSPVLPPPPA